MLRRKPSKIEVKAEDREELEDVLRQRALKQPRGGQHSTNPSPNPNPNPLHKYLDPKPFLDPASKGQRIGLQQP